MKNLSPVNHPTSNNAARSNLREDAKLKPASNRWKIVRVLCVTLLLIGIALVPGVAPFAQKKEAPVNVTGVSSRKTGDGAVVTISADAPLTRTQTWQDAEGFHLTLPGTNPGALKGLPRGVTVRNLGKSLEVVVAVKPGAGVTVDPRFNNLNLIVTGGVDTTESEVQLEPPASGASAHQPSERAFESAQPARQLRGRNAPLESVRPDSPAPTPLPATTSAPSSPLPMPAAGTSTDPAPQQTAPIAESLSPASAASTISDPGSEADSGGISSYIFSTTGVLVLLLVGIVALVGVRRHRSKHDSLEETGGKNTTRVVRSFELVDNPVSPAAEEGTPRERRRMLRRHSDNAMVKSNNSGNPSHAQQSDAEGIEKRSIAPVLPALFGAYRVDQEVGKLVLGQAHRLDVLSSRSPDDRRALETSLVKAMNAPESGEDGRRKAREALEEYGFVARQCASLLLSHNAYDRASAARTLGEIASQASLPFLLEALYDTEGIVRAEAVTSLGELKMPSAIGALLDMARRHPEMPTALVSRALSACSVECFDFFDTVVPDRLLLEAGDEGSYGGEITHLDPAGRVEALPQWFEDEDMTEALQGLREEDCNARASAARRLSQFQVQPAVEALTAAAANDPESTVRAAAVTSLGEIEHETVFAPIIMAFADEAREVRAAAARSLSRMSLDRAEAYVRLIETATPETLCKVAQACIKAGMVAQAIDRLISEDRRLAYEAFSLLSLLAKSDQTDPLTDAISSHPEINIRLAVVRLLGTSGGPEVATLLRHLAVRDGLPEKVRTALLEVVYKIDQTQPV